MKLNEYQESAGGFAKYPWAGQIPGRAYTALQLAAEAGEYAGKLAKAIRDDNGIISDERHAAMILELGDVLWYIQQNATELGVTLEEIAKANIEKLTSRRDRGVLGGSGDNR
jgi:NTP pyrophosphatase (non-canonical NTP hydrolase)